MKAIAPIIACFFVAMHCYAQCPPRDSLWNRIIYLRDQSGMKLDEQQKELLPYLSKMQQCPYKNDSTHTLLVGRIGALYFLQGDYLTGIKYIRQQMQMIYENANKSNISQVQLVRSYNNLRICYDALGQKNLKMAAIDSCIAVSIRLNKGYDMSLAMMYYKTVSYMESGDYYRCIDYATFSENVARKAGYGLEVQTEFATWRINALVLLKKYAEAEALSASYIDSCLKNSALRNVGALYGLLGTTKIEKGQPESAIELYDKSVYYYKKAKIYDGVATVLNNAGDLYLKSFNRHSTALQYYQNALVFTTEAKKGASLIGQRMNILNGIAGVFIKRGQYDSAFYYFQKSFDEIQPGITEVELAKTPERFLSAELAEYVSNLVLNKADAYLALYDSSKDQHYLVSAIDSYKRIDQLFDRMKFGQTDVESKLYWRSRIRRLYENAIKACYYQGNEADAFHFFEKSKAVLLQDQLNEQRLLNSDDIMQQTQAIRLIATLQRQFEAAQPGPARDSLQAEMLKRKQDLDHIKKNIKEKNRFYYQNAIDTSLLTISDVQKNILNDRDALIEFFNGDSAVYVFAISRNQSSIQRLSKQVYDTLTNSFVKFLSNNELINNQFDLFQKTASNLYMLIFSNLHLSPGRIIISPDGKYFPFEALITNKDAANPQYFIEDHAVSYTYSARFLINAFEQNKNTSGQNFMGMAPVQFATAWNLPTLAGSDASLDRVESHFSSSSSWTSAEATRKNFLNNFYRYKILQLYTHATAGGSNEQPVIYFADSALSLSDLLYENKPFTDLVVLSACETGTGKLYEGEGVFGFNRGFAAIGIPSTIASLWRVENSSTYKLTELFYQYLAKGMPVDIALQNAKKEFIKTAPKEKQLPYYWAAPILTGKTDPIELKKSFLWIYILAGAGLAFLFIVARIRGITRMQIRK